jgi:hypothetical protein
MSSMLSNVSPVDLVTLESLMCSCAKKRPSMSVVQRTVELFGSAAPQAPAPA